MNDVKISVVVPVYNVEPYLAKCMDSLLRQTYGNYEILLVDDGSTDKSGEMCGRYAGSSPRVRAFHKENGGLSSARNYAAPYLSGQFVSYVDPDDYVEPDCLEALAGAVEDENDMAAAPHWREYPDGSREGPEVCSEEVFTPERALAEMCYEKRIGTSACCKLIPAGLVKRFPFPEGKLYEDLAAVYKMISNCRRVTVLGKPLYHYIQRPGSIMNTGWRPSVMDVMEASDSLLEYAREKLPGVYPAAVHRYFVSAGEVYKRALREDNYRALIAPVRGSLKGYWKILRRDPRVVPLQKLKYWMMAFSPGSYRIGAAAWGRLSGRGAELF